MNNSHRETWSPMEPQDSFNRILEDHVRPESWDPPIPQGTYNIVVIGAGTAGLVTAAVAAGLGAKVALIEKERMGGDCLNVGCVPSKGVIAAARKMASISQSSNFGIEAQGVDFQFSKAMERMRRIRAQIGPDDSAKRFQDLGVDVFFGNGCFKDSSSIQVNDQILKFKKAVIATGARAAAPPIQGLETISYLTNENLFSLTDLPKTFGVVGGGPIGVEMAQSFARFGSQVTLFENSSQILMREEPDASSIVHKALERDGVDIRTRTENLRFQPHKDGGIQFLHEVGETQCGGQFDQLLIAVGRAPNVSGLGLENANVEFDLKNGVRVNDYLQTSNPNIYACGDVCSRFKFTHAADFMARTVISNALFFGRSKVSSLIIPWTTYSDPELAHVGLYPAEIRERGFEPQSLTKEFSDVHRALLDGEEDGFVRVHTKKGSDQILGATVVGPHAGDMISHLTFAMTQKIGLKKIANTIHPYPTQGEAIRQLGDLYKKSALTPKVKSVLTKFFQWRRR